LNGTVTHVTSSLEKPSSLATAYATADSNPWPVVGSLLLNHGSKAGESVPTVSVPGVSRESCSFSQASAAEVDDELSSSSTGAQPSAPPSSSTERTAADRVRRMSAS
jgi:hypothetical protein